MLTHIFVLFCLVWFRQPTAEIQHSYHENVYTTTRTFKKVMNSPCDQTNIKHEVIINCTGRMLDRFNSSWFPLNTTIIYLEENLLTEIENVTFNNLTFLHLLSMRNNTINKIQTNAFSRLTNLRVLNLEYNSLKFDNNSYPDGIFSPLVNLRKLYLRQDRDFTDSEYPSCFLCSLTHLTTLSIDSVGEMVNFGPEFKKLRNLKHLFLSTHYVSIIEGTFKNVIHLTHLEIYGNYYLYNFSNMTLAHLPFLKSFKIYKAYIGNTQALNILKPLVGRNMTVISLNKVCLLGRETVSSHHMQDGIIDAEKTKYLRQICVRRFEFTSSILRILEGNAFLSETLHSCLKHLDLSKNDWMGSTQGFITPLTLRSLESIYMEDIVNVPATPNKFTVNKFENTERTTQYEFDTKLTQFENKTKLRGFIWYGSGMLKNIYGKKWIGGPWSNINITFVGWEHVKHVDFTDNRIDLASGIFRGLTGLKTLLISGSDMSSVSAQLADTIPSVENLALANLKFDTSIFQSTSARIFKNLKSLKRLDLSLNSLSFLAKNTFSSNNQLIEMYLATNRFTEIPFDLRFTPMLQILDLSENAISTLDEKITMELDAFVERNGHLSLRLAKNVLSCGCENFIFIKWILSTNVKIDFDSNLTCVNESGLYSHLDKHLNFGTFWRQCVGQQYLYISVVILCVFIIIFLGSFVIMRCKLYIVAYVAQILGTVPRRRLTDFQNHVFILSSPNEGFVTVLRNYLKQYFFLNIRDCTDLEPGRPEFEDLFVELNATWRVILVVTEEFFHDNNFQMLYTLVLNSMSHDNPGKVLLLYESNLPLNVDLVNAIGEDNIICVRSWKITSNMDEFLYDRIFIDY